MTEENNEVKDTRKIKYVKHPVTKKEKAKIRAQGFIIIDERFDPNYKPPTKAAPPTIVNPASTGNPAQ